VTVALFVFAGILPASAQTAQFRQRFKDWSTYTFSNGPGKLCFAVTQPKDFLPKSLKRDDVYLYVSSWPGDGVTNELSVKIGYSFKKGSTPTATVGADVFQLFTDGDRAFVESVTQEARLIDAMRRGAKLVIKGLSAGGQQTTDVFSLSGITAALGHIKQICK